MVMIPADVWMVSMMYTGALSNTDAQMTTGSLFVMALFMRCRGRRPTCLAWLCRSCPSWAR